jgi:hypothetical protein
LRKKYINDIKNKLITLGTNEETTRVLLYHLQAWLQNTTIPPIKEIAPNASPYLINAITEQSIIGWDQWLQGRLSTTWGEIYRNDIKHPNIHTKYPSVNRWGKEVIRITYKFVLESWYIQNKSEHETELNASGREKEKYTEEIQWLIKMKQDNIPQQFVIVTKEELLTLPKENLKMMIEQLKKINSMTQ